MSDLANIDPSQFVTVQGKYAVLNQGTGYAILNTQTNEILAHNISSFLDCVKTLEYIVGDEASRQTTRQSSPQSQPKPARQSPPETESRDFSPAAGFSNQSRDYPGLTNYYPLPGLLKRLTEEVETYVGNNAAMANDRILNPDSFRHIQQASKHCQWLAEDVLIWHNDHQCSKDNAEQLATELRQLALRISMVQSVGNLRIAYQVVALMTYQISRFKHSDPRWYWDSSMRTHMLNPLNDCVSENFLEAGVVQQSFSPKELVPPFGVKADVQMLIEKYAPSTARVEKKVDSSGSRYKCYDSRGDLLGRVKGKGGNRYWEDLSKKRHY